MKEQNGHIHSLDQLQAFADGTLDHALARDVERHLADCRECRATVDRLRALDERIGRAESADAPAGYFDTFGSRVASRIAAAKRPAPLLRRLRLAWWGLVPAAAAAVLALVVSLDHEPQTAVRQLVRIPAPEAGPGDAGDWPAPEMAADGDQREKVGSRDGEVAAPAAPVMTSPAAAPPPPEVLALSDAADKEEADDGARAMKRTASKSSPAEAMEYDRPDAATAGQAAPAAEGKTASAPVAAVAPGTVVEIAPAGSAMIVAEIDTPAPVFEQLPAPREIGAITVIVIHLPDGAAYCPAPHVATAIAIRMSRPGER